MEIDQDNLKTENAKLAAVLRDKSRRHQQTQELYDRLKRKEMNEATRAAAYDSVDEVLQSAASRQSNGSTSLQHAPQYPPLSKNQLPQLSPRKVSERNVIQQGHTHRRDDSTGDIENSRMMPPPLARPTANYGNHSFALRK